MSKEDDAAGRYTCCECPADMTDAVSAAAVESQFTMRRADMAIRRQPETVTVQCPKGHWCVYNLGDGSH
jgi:hypothetical protein